MILHENASERTNRIFSYQYNYFQAFFSNNFNYFSLCDDQNVTYVTYHAIISKVVEFESIGNDGKKNELKIKGPGLV